MSSQVEARNAMLALTDKMQARTDKAFISGLMKYLLSDKRKDDELCRKYTPPAPAMSKQEQVIVFVLSALRERGRGGATPLLLSSIEYALFRLNHTPELHQVERLARLFAVVCRAAANKRRLRVFMLDAMYSISYKAVPLVQQCLNVWMNVLPLAHMNTGIYLRGLTFFITDHFVVIIPSLLPEEFFDFYYFQSFNIKSYYRSRGKTFFVINILSVVAIICDSFY